MLLGAAAILKSMEDSIKGTGMLFYYVCMDDGDMTNALCCPFDKFG